MNCTQCSHPYSSHTLGTELRCRMQIAYGWDEERETFTRHAPCRCTGYRGLKPGDEKCPHEYVETTPGCVYCGHVRSPWERKV